MEFLRVSGIHMLYYAICKRKMWLYDHGITLENEYDRVLEGKILHENSYKHIEEREIMIDNAFKIDLIEGDHVREVKISSKMTEADVLQMLFYLYQLELRGVKKKGLISYTNERKTEEIILDDNSKEKVEKAIADSEIILSKNTPPAVKRLSYCKKCAYYNFCFAMEVE